MLLFEPTYDAIIEALVDQKSLTIQDLYQKIGSIIGISLPNFYKIISRLISDQILIKDEGKISIHKKWILGISRLSQQMNELNQEDDTQEIVMMKDGQSLEFFGGSILEIDGLWGHLMITLNHHYGAKTDTFVYQAHPYYVLGTQETEIGFFEQEAKLSTIYLLVGNTSWLDTYGIELYTPLGIQVRASELVPFPREGYCVTIIGDHIFEFMYPEHITEYFRLLFETTASFETFNPELFKKIFEIRTRCKLVVRKNKKYAEELRKKFLVYFA